MSVATKNSAYNTVGRDDFDAMIDVGRYAKRSPYFEEIIERTREHFWNPEDPDYIDFSPEFPRDQPILSDKQIPELQSAVADRLDEQQKVELSWDITRWTLSQFLHGEQGALSLSSSLIDVFIDPAAQEYMTNQAREEARHVRGFARYIHTRFPEGPLPCGQTLGNLLREMVASPEVYKKVIGMQMMIEGLAMGAFATMHKDTFDPVLKRTVQLTMTDEAFHHQFGKIWAQHTIPELTEEEHNQAEDWAQHTFLNLFENLVNATQKAPIYAKYDLTPEWVMEAVQESFTDEDKRQNMTESTDIFRVLVKTLVKAGIITDRTRATYAMWVDLEELQREEDGIVAADVVNACIEELKEINSSKRTLIKLRDNGTVRTA